MSWGGDNHKNAGNTNCGAAYGTGATQMVTEEALAERKAALEGDPGVDGAVKLDMPQEEPMHSAKHQNGAQQHQANIESRVSTCRCTCAGYVTSALPFSPNSASVASALRVTHLHMHTSM